MLLNRFGGGVPGPPEALGLISGKQSVIFCRNPFKHVVFDPLLAKSRHISRRFLMIV